MNRRRDDDPGQVGGRSGESLIEEAGLGAGIDKVFEALRTLSRSAERLPDEVRKDLDDTLAEAARRLQALRPGSRELERLATFPVLNPQPVMQVHPETGRFDFINPAAERIIPGLREAGHDHPWLRGLTGVADELRRSGQAFVTREVQIGDRWFEQDISLVRGAQSVRIYGRDITLRRRAEAELQASEARYRGLFDSIKVEFDKGTDELARALGALADERQRFNDVLDMLPAYVVLLNRDHEVPFVNRFFRERFGEPGGRRCYEFLFGRTGPCPDCETFKVLETGAPHRWEWTGPDGRCYHVYDFPFTDRDGSRLILEMGIDITERRQAEEERLRLATAVEQIPDGIAIMDVEGRILSANPAFAGHHGLEAGTMSGRALSGLLELGVEEEHALLRLRESLESGQIWGLHLKRRAEDGRTREFDLSVSPIHDGSGRLVNSIAIERDVTQEVQLEERVRQWQKMEALGNLAGGIAHDFNNILLPILINVELMLADEKADTPEARRLSLVLDAARRGRDMVKQIIAFSRRQDQERKPVDIRAVIRESIKFLRVSIPKTIEIVEKPGPEEALVLADPTQIQQVLINLGGNAAHAMRENGGVLEIGLEEAMIDAASASAFIGLKPGPFLRLTVRDTGHGMTPDVAARVFEPFFTTKKPGEGTGMGLAVVHGIVKSHGGSISVASEPGRGTTFTIHLPRIMGSLPAEEHGAAPFPRGSERILFIDDEPLQVKAMTKLLEHLGYRVSGTTDPLEALEEFQRRPDAYDLVVTDQTMPRLTGGELARRILALRPDLPIIVCTGYSESIDEAQAQAMGVRALVMKPFSVREIAERIRSVLPRAA